MTEMGEYLVGAYLKHVQGCERIEYNVHFPGSRGLKRLDELDVIGYNYDTKTVFLCEVTTHIRGMLYGSSREFTVRKIANKHSRQKEYADKWISGFPNRRFMLWSPVVPRGYLTDNLAKIDQDSNSRLELIINTEFSKRIADLEGRARTATHNDENPAFRLLQILAHLRT